MHHQLMQPTLMSIFEHLSSICVLLQLIVLVLAAKYILKCPTTHFPDSSLNMKDEISSVSTFHL